MALSDNFPQITVFFGTPCIKAQFFVVKQWSEPSIVFETIFLLNMILLQIIQIISLFFVNLVSSFEVENDVGCVKVRSKELGDLNTFIEQEVVKILLFWKKN